MPMSQRNGNSENVASLVMNHGDVPMADSRGSAEAHFMALANRGAS